MQRTLLHSIVLLLLSSTCWASQITYNATSLGGNAWRYDYTLVNDTLTDPVEEFTIYFDVGLFESLRSPAGPSPWDLLVIQPDPGLPVPADGFFDGLVFDIADALAPGATLGVFSVEFDFLGTGIPGRQSFEFYGADLELLASGSTRLAGANVPEPGTLALIAAGLLGLLRSRKRARA